MMASRCDPIDVTQHINHAEENNGFAAPMTLSGKQKSQLLRALEEVPTSDSMFIHKAKFKGGNLHILVSVDGQLNPEAKHWWSVDLYPDYMSLTEEILSKGNIRCYGSPKKYMRRLLL